LDSSMPICREIDWRGGIVNSESESGDFDSESASGIDISASAPDGYDHQWLPSALESRVVDRWQYIYGDCLLIPV